jgi:hypothetical protein
MGAPSASRRVPAVQMFPPIAPPTNGGSGARASGETSASRSPGGAWKPPPEVAADVAGAVTAERPPARCRGCPALAAYL